MAEKRGAIYSNRGKFAGPKEDASKDGQIFRRGCIAGEASY